MGLCSFDPAPKKFKQLYKGDDATIDCKLFAGSDPLDLSAASEIKAILLNQDSTYLELKLTDGDVVLISGPGGHFQIILTKVQTALLMASAEDALSDIEVRYVIAGQERTYVFEKMVQIKERRFPSAP